MHWADLGSFKRGRRRVGRAAGALGLACLAFGHDAARAAPSPPSGPSVLSAQPTGVTQGVTTGSWSVQYDGFSHGLLVLKMRASLHFTPAGYEGSLSFHTAGMVGWMVRSIDDSEVTGAFVPGQEPAPSPDRVLPASFVSVGSLRGVERVTRMTYRDGSPVIGTLTPDVTLERSPVAPAASVHTIDTLSAIAMLVRQVGDTGRCDGSTMIFDGRRLTALAARTGGADSLAHTDRSIFSGQTLRCDFDGNQIGGFKKDENEAAQRKTRHGIAWLASVLPGAPPMPVRVIFDNKILGQVTLYLTAAQPSFLAGGVHG